MAKKYVAVLNLYWLGWQYIYIYIYIYIYGYLNNLNPLDRYCGSHLKVVESRSQVSTQVYQARNFYLSIHVCIRIYRFTELWLCIY